MTMYESLVTKGRLVEMRQNGALVFDVDDTILMRKGESAGRDQIYSDSESARTIPELLFAGLRVCFITGHGWAQLAERLVEPLVADTRGKYPADADLMLSNLFVYANRGATRARWNGGSFKVDEGYGRGFIIDPRDRDVLISLLSGLADQYTSDLANAHDGYSSRFKSFRFGVSPPRVFEREGVILGLRPVLSEAMGTEKKFLSPRQLLCSEGRLALKALGLDGKYELGESGRSTVEIIRNSVSKSVAFRHLLITIGNDLGIVFGVAEQSTIYVGDEFAVGGNDRSIPIDFPQCLCFSVARESGLDVPSTVIQLSEQTDKLDSAAAQLSKYILKVLVDDN